MMNSPSNLMNYPDAYGQYYHPTPTPAAMAPATHISHPSTSLPPTNYYENTEKIITQSSTQGHWHDPNLYYGSRVEDESQLQALDDYYYYEDNPRYSNRKGPMYDYYDYEMDQRIHDIRKNDAIFRQGGSGDWLGNFVSTALQIITLVASVLGDGSETPKPTVDRVDTASVAAAAASGTDDLDIAMGTLMAYGGKYLREIALSAWEYGTQQPLNSIGGGSTTGGTSDSQSSSTSSVTSPLAAVVSAASRPSKPYLSTLSQAELEKIGLKAVAAGANPQQLQQAFATAQLQGDWSKLEKLISDKLGIEAINPPEVGLAASAQATVSQFLNTGGSVVTNAVSGGGDTSSGAGGGIISTATNYITRLQNVIDPPPIALKPNGDPVNPEDLIKNQNVVTRFAAEFGLTNEMLQLQKGVNTVILTINNFLGEGPPQNVDRIGSAAATNQQSSSSSVSTAGSSPLSLLTSIPQAIGAAAVAAIKFITPQGGGAASKIANDPSSTSSYSEIKPFVDLNQIAFGVLGVAALGSVGYATYASRNKKKNRRIYQRSANNEVDQMWIQVGKLIFKGLLEDERNTCQMDYDRCINQTANFRTKKNDKMAASEMWIKKCLARKYQCENKLPKLEEQNQNKNEVTINQQD